MQAAFLNLPGGKYLANTDTLGDESGRITDPRNIHHPQRTCYDFLLSPPDKSGYSWIVIFTQVHVVLKYSCGHGPTI
jgi:hypothetical protein